MSVLFVLLLIGTHFTEESAFPEVGTDGKIPGSWARHAIITSLDWGTSNRFANAIMGGSNTHAAHHLFPGISHAHYPAISKIIKEVAEKYSVPYKGVSLAHMVRSHFKFLKSMST